jgi:hypothetical protein
LGIIESTLQIHDVGDTSIGKLAHIRSVPDRSANRESFRYPAVLYLLIIGDFFELKVIHQFPASSRE